MKCLGGSVIVALVALVYLLDAKQKSSFYMKSTNVQCIANASWFTNVTCRIKAHSRTKNYVDMYGAPIQPLRKLNLVISLWKRLSGWHPWLMSNITGSACNFMSGKYKMLWNIVENIVQKYSNFNHSCPYTEPIFTKNLSFDEFKFNTLVLRLPSGVYRLDIHVYENPGEYIGSLMFYFSVSGGI